MLLTRSMPLLLAATLGARAATMSASSTAPAVNGADIAFLGTVTGNDKWFVENSAAGAAKGQTFTTGSLKVMLKSITYQVAAGNGAAPTKTYVVRVGSVFSNIFTEIHRETATQTFAWSSGEFMTWTFATPVLLEANTVYGVDVGMTASTSAWQTGIPYINVGGNGYAGGARYSSGTNGVGTPQMTFVTNSDRIFHLDMDYLPHGFQLILE